MTIQDFSKDPKWIGGQLGMTAILHTWGQNMSLHPHLHCIVPGGGISPEGKWNAVKSRSKILFPVKALSKVFRGKYLAILKKALPDLSKQMLNQFYKYKWVVYAKLPFAGPHHVIEYLGRYTHKIAISNHRIIQISDGVVTFSYKDYRHGGAKKIMKLTEPEFIRRFSLHILPKRFVRMRHYGILSSSWKKTKLKNIQLLLNFVPPDPGKPNIKNQCPFCKMSTMVTLLTFGNRGPPSNWSELFKTKDHAQ